MVKWQPNIIAVSQKPSVSLITWRRAIYDLTCDRWLPPAVVADLMYWHGVISDELQKRAVGERVQLPQGVWADRVGPPTEQS